MTEKIIVIASFPPKGSIHGNKYSAVASYTKNTLDSINLSLDKNDDVKFTVLADVLESSNDYIDGNIQVKRCWSRNSQNPYFSLIREVLKLRDHKKVIFEFEFGMFGGNKILIALVPIFILKLRFLGKKIYTVSHAVILDSSEISGQLGYPQKSLTASLYDFSLKLIYFMIVLSSTKVIVFEEYLRKKLIKSVSFATKINTIPHGVEENRKVKIGLPPKIKNSDFTVLNFGFVIWYKGSDWLISAVNESKIASNIKFILAGGFSNVHKTNKIYQKYMKKVETNLDLAKEKSPLPQILMTGFLKETDIDSYFSSCDVVILPYRVLISASGPLSFAISHKKPFILSENLKGYMEDVNFKNAMGSSGVSEADLFFDMTVDKFATFINNLKNTPATLEKLHKLSKMLLEQRSWKETGKKYAKAIW